MPGAAGQHPAVRHLLAQGLVEGPTLVVAAPGAVDLSGPGPLAAAKLVRPQDLALEPGHYRTVIDLAGLPAGTAERTRHARRLADVVEVAGFLHVVFREGRDGRDGPDALTQADLLRVFRRGWTLLAVHDADALGTAGDDRSRLASFVHGPARRRRPAPPVRHFTDLGAFGSLDLGAAADRPPWGK